MNIIKHILAVDEKLQLKVVDDKPLTVDTIRDNALTWVSGLAGIIAFIYLIYCGFQYLTAAGNSEQSKKGGQTLVNAILGLMIIALAYGITTYVIGLLKTPVPTKP